MYNHYRRRRSVLVFSGLVLISFMVIMSLTSQQAPETAPVPVTQSTSATEVQYSAKTALEALPVKGRAPKTNYARTQFGNGWEKQGDCDTRNIILNRDMTDVVVSDGCKVQSGTLQDPYTGEIIHFQRGSGTSGAVQIDHVVALSNAWQTGAQQLLFEKRIELANDPLNLLAVDGPANQQKGDSDAASWLPSNKPFRCQYVARQVSVKDKYGLWVTAPEKQAIERVLAGCPGQRVIFPALL